MHSAVFTRALLLSEEEVPVKTESVFRGLSSVMEPERDFAGFFLCDFFFFNAINPQM